MDEQLIAFILNLAGQHPKVAALFLVIGGFRFMFKPLMFGIEKAVEYSENKHDDAKLAEIKANKIYKIAMFILDYMFSFKNPKDMLK